MLINDLHSMSANDWNSGFDEGFRKGYSKAIDDFVEKLCEAFDETILNDDGYYPNNVVRSIAKQLKAGEKNGNSN